VLWLRGTLEDAPWREINAFAPEVCVHTAWPSAPQVPYDSPEHWRCKDASEQFLRRAADTGVKYILGVGTCIEYRVGGYLLREDETALEPATEYAKAKDALRRLLEAESTRLGFGLGWARVFYAFGVGEHPSRLCSSIIEKLRRGETITLKTPRSTKDYIYVTDVAGGLLAILERGFKGAVNVCTGAGIPIADLARSAATMLGKPDLIEEAAVASPDPLGYVVGDSTRLRSLGWQPEYNLPRGLETMIRARQSGDA
jgi:dTDP-6-deoxy-L-talose 4-dehydrogenase (NAD+)